MVIGGEVYPIRTDFRAGIEYHREVKSDNATLASLFRIWFPEATPEDSSEALEAIHRFYRRSDAPPENTSKGPTAFDFDKDADAICAAFMREYGIDLTTVEMHWWRFMALMDGLYSYSFADRVGFRTADLTGLDSKQRAKLLKKRNHFSLDEYESTADHLARLDSIIARSGGGNDGGR